MSKHTPGPWRYTETSGYSTGYYNRDWKSVSVETADGSIKVGYGAEKRYWDRPEQISQPFPIEEFERAQANARLIAAAPEMLDILKWLQGCVETLLLAQMIDELQAAIKDVDHALERAQAAIAKAEGRE